MEGKNFEKWYKDSFNGLEENPPSNIWEGVSDHLDHSARKAASIRLRYVGFSLMLLLLLGGATGAYFLNVTSPSSSPENTGNLVIAESNAENIRQAEKASETGEQVSTPQAWLSDNRKSKTIAEIKQAPVNNNNSFATKKEKMYPENAGNDIGEKKGALTAANSESEQPESLAKAAEFPADAESSEGEHIDQFLNDSDDKWNTGKPITRTVIEPIPINRYAGNSESALAMASYEDVILPGFQSQKNIYAGAVFTVNKLFLLNHDTYDGFRAASLTSSVPKYDNDYGFHAGINFSGNAAVEVELLKTARGQLYHQYVEGSYVQQEIDLQYTQIGAMFKKKSIKLGLNGRVPISVNWIGGMYYANMYRAESLERGNIVDISNEFSSNDFGLLLGLEYEVELAENIIASAAFRASGSLFNIYTGNEKIPRDFNRTRNLSLGGNFGLKYLLPLK